MKTNLQLSRVLLAIVLFAFASVSSAAVFVIGAELTGDPRAANPDNLNVDVTITGDTSTNVATWVVDLDMAVSHPSARLEEFGFNLDVQPGETFLISNLNPAYTVSINDNLQGSGNMTFLFTLDSPPGNVNDANNSVNLTFTLTKTAGGSFTTSDFLAAPDSCSNDATLGCAQMAAHIQAAGPNANLSGIALGDTTLRPSQIPVSEPGMLLLTSLGLLTLGLVRRRRS